MDFHFNVGDTIVLKKEHPCGEKKFSILYVGSDVKIRCLNCSREMMIPRVKLEKSMKKILTGENNDQQA